MSTIALRKKLRRQAGLTAVETLLALAAGALAVLGAVVLYQSAIASDKVTKGQQGLAAIQEGVRSLFAGSANYVGLDNTALINAKAVPSDMIQSATELRHAWKGPVTVVPVAGNTSQFTVTYDLLPEDACIKMMTGQSGAAGSGLISVAGETGVAVSGDDLPVDLAEATARCSDGSGNTVVWTFQ